MKDIVIVTIWFIGLFIALIIVIKEERKMHDNYLKNEIEKTKKIIEELKND